MARSNVKFGDALSSTFNAGITILDSAEPAVARISKTLSLASDTVDAGLRATRAYAMRAELSAIQGYNEALEELGGVEKLQQLRELIEKTK